ncbi:MAG: DUF5665 domain-containing protein [Candidatus Nomurabacteria bacterium]|jgi:hypothetical protein|nr:DUF5665 domain-containing protein [Candidatus Nomurabacteria bacterium]
MVAKRPSFDETFGRRDSRAVLAAERAAALKKRGISTAPRDLSKTPKITTKNQAAAAENSAKNSKLSDGRTARTPVGKTTANNQTAAAAQTIETVGTKSFVKAKPLTESQRALIRQLFEEVWTKRRGRMIGYNFLRGVAFGFGSLVGGTIVVAILVWILARVVNWFPMIQGFTQSLIDSLHK